MLLLASGEQAHAAAGSGERMAECCSVGGATTGRWPMRGATTMGLFDGDEMEDEAERLERVALDLAVLATLAARSRLRAGGRGTGSSAGFVFSYRRATKPVSSRKHGLLRPGRDLWRTKENLVEPMAAWVVC